MPFILPSFFLLSLVVDWRPLDTAPCNPLDGPVRVSVVCKKILIGWAIVRTHSIHPHKSGPNKIVFA